MRKVLFQSRIDNQPHDRPIKLISMLITICIAVLCQDEGSFAKCSARSLKALHFSSDNVRKKLTLVL